MRRCDATHQENKGEEGGSDDGNFLRLTNFDDQNREYRAISCNFTRSLHLNTEQGLAGKAVGSDGASFLALRYRHDSGRGSCVAARSLLIEVKSLCPLPLYADSW